jgi:hypothetical protein
MAKVAIKPPGGHGEHGGNQWEQSGQHGLDPHEICEGNGGLGRGRAVLRTSKTSLGSGRWLLLGFRFGLADRLVRCAAHPLLDASGKRVPCLVTDERQGEKRQPWHRLVVQAGEETVQAMGRLASLGYDDFRASQQVDIRWTVPVLLEEPAVKSLRKTLLK